MSGLTEFQKKRCPSKLSCEDWKMCSKCANGKIVEGMIGSHSKCTLTPTTPMVLTIVGRNKREVLQSLSEIEDKLEHGYRRGKVNDNVFWNRDAEVPSYFTYDYDEEVKKK